MVVGIDHVDPTLVNINSDRSPEFTFTYPLDTPCGNECTGEAEHLYPIVTGVCDIHIATNGSDCTWFPKLTFGSSFAPPLDSVRAVRGGHRYPMIELVRQVYCSP